MADNEKALESKFQPKTRYNNFGTFIRSIRIDGFRGIHDLEIPFEFPVTAISGLNGSGKSTIGQICLSGYKETVRQGGYKRFYVKDFFPASAADPDPFTDTASVIFSYETDDFENPKKATVRRARSRWGGYKRQPERACFYVGFTIYIPKVERKDLSIYGGSAITLTKPRLIEDEVREKVGRILGQQYDELHFQGIRHGKKSGELGVAARFGYRYSENNMGFGEGRVLYLVDLLENSPEKSLFVIEEPETSLHEHAQHELAKYFLDVCHRRSHQIIISTHSDKILGALPSKSRIFLRRDSSGVTLDLGISATTARALLSRGYTRDFFVFVEDEFAESLLGEMIRRIDPFFRRSICIKAVGNTNDVRNANNFVRQQLGKPCIAVRDADTGANPSSGLLSLPGSKPPEKEVYEHPGVKQYFAEQFSLDIDNELALKNVTDHHKFSEVLADACDLSAEHIKFLAIGKYLDELGEHAYSDLVHNIRNAV
jgi:predicted ATPase